MATCEYEILRQQRIADNRKRMEQLGLQKVCTAALSRVQAYLWAIACSTAESLSQPLKMLLATAQVANISYTCGTVLDATQLVC